MDHPYCYTCPYWDSEIYANDMLMEPEIDGRGDCRRYPPHLHPNTYMNRDCDPEVVKDRERMGMTLTTEAGDWCGEHPDFPAYIKSLRERADGGPLPPVA